LNGDLEEKRFPAKQRYTAWESLTVWWTNTITRAASPAFAGLAEPYQAEKETYIPLAFEPGTNAQCDWESGYVYLDGEYTAVQLFDAHDQFCPFVYQVAKGTLPSFKTPQGEALYP